MRFSELKKVLGGITSMMLSDRLFEQEQDGVVAKNVVQCRTEYSLTAGERNCR